MHFEQRPKTRGFLTTPVAQLQTDLLILLRRHGLKQSELLGHQPQGKVHAAEERDHPVGVLLLKVVVNVEKRITDQLHPHFFHLVNDLELQFVRIAEILEIFLAGKKRLGVQIDFVVEGSFPIHDGIKMRTVHRISPMKPAPRVVARHRHSIASDDWKSADSFPERTRRGPEAGQSVAPLFAANSLNDTAKFGVGQEAMFADALVFDSCQHRGSLRFGDLESEFLGFQGDAVETALFSQNNLPTCADQAGGKRLDRFGDVKLAGDRATFAHEKVLADDRFPGLEGVSAGALNEFGDFTNVRKLEGDGNVIEAAEGESDFREVGVAGAFAHAVDGALNPGGAGADGSDGTSGGHAKVVVTVEMNGNAVAHPLANLADEVLDGFGTAGADGVDDDNLCRACLERSEVDPFKEFKISPCAVYGKKGHTDAIFAVD